jgi:hypothetical protein
MAWIGEFYPTLAEGGAKSEAFPEHPLSRPSGNKCANARHDTSTMV